MDFIAVHRAVSNYTFRTFVFPFRVGAYLAHLKQNADIMSYLVSNRQRSLKGSPLEKDMVPHFSLYECNGEQT